MKIYIITDIEGATGVFEWRQTKKDTPEFREAVVLLMGDIAAVAEGLRAAGAAEIFALDGHDGGNNFIPTCMIPGVRYITGRQRGRGFAGLDSSYDGVVLLGYHAMNGAPEAVLHHTQSSVSESKYWYNEVERGEIYQCAVFAGHFDVPVIMVTGDEAACREARATLGEDLPVVAVKKGIDREAAVLLPAEETKQLLGDGARRAIADLPKRKPLKPSFPLRLRVRSIRPGEATLDNPWFAQRECEVRSALDIISGSPS